MNTGGRARVLVAVMLAMTVATAVPASARANTVALPGAGHDVRWEGSVPPGAVADPALCTVDTCAVTTLVLKQPTSRLVIAVDTSARENTFDFLYDIQLHVYGPGGHLRGSDTSSFETNVVVIDNAAAGAWRIVVMPERVVGQLHYRGYAASTATLAPAGPPGPTQDLLPNLVPQPLTHLGLKSAPAAGPPPLDWDFRNKIHGATSCYAQEMVELGARRCLRFDQTVANLGAGSLELRARQVGDGPMDQVIARSDGSTRLVPVGAVAFHLQHLHFHYQGYARVRLYRVGVDGRRGTLVREGAKQGFCLADTHDMRFGRPDDRAPTFTDPLTCTGQEISGVQSRVGISPGWADRYPWFIPEQFIEITGVPNGRYLIEFSVNESGALRESRTDDNKSSVVFDLRRNDVSVVSSGGAS